MGRRGTKLLSNVALKFRGNEAALARYVTRSALTTKNRFLFFVSAWKRSASRDQKRFRPARFFFGGGGRAFKYSSGVFASSCLLVTRRVVVSSKVGSQRHSAPITAIIARFPPSILASSPFDLTPLVLSQRRRVTGSILLMILLFSN